MHTPWSIKIRIILALSIGAAAFWFIGWPALKPIDPTESLTIILHHRPVVAILVSAALIIAATIMAVVVTKPHCQSIAVLAAPAGLTILAIVTPDCQTLLLHNASVPDRAALFFRNFVPDTLIWFAMVTLGCVVTHFVTKMLFPVSKHAVSESLPDEKAHKSQNVVKHDLSQKNVQIINYFLALALTCIIATILLRITTQSGTAEGIKGQAITVAVTPAKGQIIFAVAASFLLAAMAGRYLFSVPPTILIFAVPIVAIITYTLAGRESTLVTIDGTSPHFVLANSVCATILPLQFVAIGSLATIAGHWVSPKARLAALQSLK